MLFFGFQGSAGRFLITVVLLCVIEMASFGWMSAIISAQSLTMRENLEQAIVFFDGFTGDHRTFLQKQRKMKKEAQERLMGDVGGTGKYNGTPPSDYCPSVERFRFVSENYLCEQCNDRFVNEANVMIHIISVHDEDIRKMFAIDASEHLEADEEYHL